MEYISSTWSWLTGGGEGSGGGGGGKRGAGGGSQERDEVKPPEKLPAEGSFGSILWSFLSSKLGADLLRAGISLPSWMYEPLSILQRQAEMIEHSEILHEGAKSKDEFEQLAYVAAFAVSGYSATERFKPNFNPLLGETFEYIDKRNGARFFAEQVSHHPPVSAFHSERDNVWKFWQNSGPTTKFLGNSIDVNTHGQSHVYFCDSKNHYCYTNPCTRVHNVIFGSMWMEHYGELNIRNLNGSSSCIVVFKQSGYFQGAQFDIEGYIIDKQGKKCVKLEGRWNSHLNGTWLVSTQSVKEGERKCLWLYRPEPIVNSYYNFRPFTVSLNEYEPIMEKLLPPTDSRRRIDRLLLEKGDTEGSSTWKRVMEDLQREDRKNRTTPWVPVWFKVSENDMDKNLWIYCGDYWEQREKKKSLIMEGRDASQLLNPPSIKGLACDFLSYKSNVTLYDPTPPDDVEEDNDN